MSAPPPSRLDGHQVLQGAFDEATGRLRTDAEATIVNADIDVALDKNEDSVSVYNSNGTAVNISSEETQLLVRSELQSTNSSLDAIETDIDAIRIATLSIDNKTPELDQGAVPTRLIDSRITSFDEILTGSRYAVLNQKPTWGVSDIRDIVFINGTITRSADIPVNVLTETGGELRLNTGSLANDSRLFRTLERGQYQPGSETEVGIGIRIPTLPTGTTDIRFGYFDGQNGIGFGVDSTGVYVARISGGVVSKVYQSSWNIDKVDGTGLSGLTLDLSAGNVFTNVLTWYGYGTIRYFVNITNPITFFKELIEVHREIVVGEVSLVDPNQPITVWTENGASPGPEVSVYIGGRQYSIVGTTIERDKRVFSESLVGWVMTAAQNVWEPLIAIKRKATHGPSGRTNTVRAVILEMDCLSDNPTEFRIMYRDTTTGGTYSSPTDVPSIESGVETKIQNLVTPFTATGTGTRIMYDYVNNGRNNLAVGESTERVPFAQELEVVLYAKRTTATTTTVSAIVRWEEDW